MAADQHTMTLIRRWLFVGLLLAMPPASSAEPIKWTGIRTQHFTVLVDGRAADAERLIRRLERLRVIFARLWPTARVDQRPVFVIAPADRPQLLALLPTDLTAPGRTHPAGVMVSGPDRVYIALTRAQSGPFPAALEVHEYVHLLVEANVPLAPLWLNEGLAEFFAAGRLDDTPAVFGLPHPSHLTLLRHHRWLGWDAVLSAVRGTPVAANSATSPMFYAQSWALVHYLKLGDNGRRAHQLTRFISLAAQGTAPAAAAREAFGDVEALDRRLREYVRGEHFFEARLPGPVEDRLLADASVPGWKTELVLADFLTHVEHYEEASRLLERIAAQRPDIAETWERRALLEVQRSRLAPALHSADRALALDGTRAMARYLRAVALLGTATGLTNAGTVEAEAELRRAIALAPMLAPAYTTLGGLLAARDGAQVEALALIERAIAIDPSAIGHHVALGQVLLMSGDTAEAQRVGERARGAARTASEREMAERLLALATGYKRR